MTDGEIAEPDGLRGAPLRAIVAADLERAERLIVTWQRALDPQWRIATPDGDYMIAFTAADGDIARRSELHMVARFMAWKRAFGFTFACELTSHEAVACMAVTRDDAAGCVCAIRRPAAKPWTMDMFAWEVWLTREEMDPGIVALLPDEQSTVTQDERLVLEAWFGSHGMFPAVQLSAGQSRGFRG